MDMIDMDKLLAFCDGDAELAMSVLEMFRKEAEVALVEMPGLYESGKMDMLSNSVHKLKSHCRYVGADQLADLAQSIENQADNGNSEKLNDQLSGFYSGLRAVLSSF